MKFLLVQKAFVLISCPPNVRQFIFYISKLLINVRTQARSQKVKKGWWRGGLALFVVLYSNYDGMTQQCDADGGGVLYSCGRTNSISDITVTLKVTGLTPTQGSMYGGTVLTVTGQGFGTNSSRVEVTLGGRGCTMDTLTGTELTCTLDYTGTTHAVTNQGTHKGTMCQHTHTYQLPTFSSLKRLPKL